MPARMLINAIYELMKTILCYNFNCIKRFVFNIAMKMYKFIKLQSEKEMLYILNIYFFIQNMYITQFLIDH